MIFAPEHLPQSGPEWLGSVRRAALARVKQSGLPSPKLERWKYTNLARFTEGHGTTLGRMEAVNENLSTQVRRLSEALYEWPEWLRPLIEARGPGAQKHHDMALWDLNAAYTDVGLVVDILPGTVLEQPIVMNMRCEDGQYVCPRFIVRLGKGAQATIIEKHEGEGRYWKNRVFQGLIGPGAQLKHYRLQNDSSEALYTQNTHVRIDRDGSYENCNITLNTGMGRNQIHADLVGKGANCKINGLNILGDKAHVDTTVLVDHQAPHCTSSQFVRSVLDDQAKAVFQGKAHVHIGADKTDATQMSNALLLSEKAEMNAKPELEIYADDVECAHGATTGQLDEQALFYMRSRGIPKKEAEQLLVQAFIGEVIDQITNDEFKTLIRSLI